MPALISSSLKLTESVGEAGARVGVARADRGVAGAADAHAICKEINIPNEAIA